MLCALFFIMLALRLAYGYLFSELKNTTPEYEVFSDFDDSRKNYATEKSSKESEYKDMSNENADFKGESTPISEPQASEPQNKYEKTATLKSKTNQFDKDEALIRAEVDKAKAVIQYEKKTGNKSERELRMLIGVVPERFDSFYIAVQKIGNIRFNEVVKVDKTNEYRTLLAEKQSYERILTSLNELKTKSGNIEEYISLHDKILEIETNLQSIGVNLGDFNTEEQFCTVRFSLLEGTSVKNTENTFWLRFKIALRWTVLYYAMSICIIAGIAFSAFFLLLLIDKIVDLSKKWSQQKKQ